MATGDRLAGEPGGTQSSSFGVTVKDLKELMQLRGADAQQEIRAKYDGVNGLCTRLKTHPSRGKIPQHSTLASKGPFASQISPRRESKFPNDYIGVIFIQIDQHLKKLLKKYKGVPILWNTVW